MKLKIRSLLFLFSIFLAVAVAPLRSRRHDGANGQPANQASCIISPAKKPDAIALLAPPPLPDSPEQAADMAEVRAVYHAATSNDIAAAYSEKKFQHLQFHARHRGFFRGRKISQDRGVF